MIIVRETESGVRYEVVQSIEKVQCPIAYRPPAALLYESGMKYSVLINGESVWTVHAYDDAERHEKASRFQTVIMSRLIAAMKTDSLYYLEDLIREEDAQ